MIINSFVKFVEKHFGGYKVSYKPQVWERARGGERMKCSECGFESCEDSIMWNHIARNHPDLAKSFGLIRH